MQHFINGVCDSTKHSVKIQLMNINNEIKENTNRLLMGTSAKISAKL
jgi:hypothetical protein